MLAACRFDGAGVEGDGGRPDAPAAEFGVDGARDFRSSERASADLHDGPLVPDYPRPPDQLSPDGGSTFAPPYIKSPEGWLQRAPLVGTSDYIEGLWSTSAQDVWAMGRGGRLLHYDGQAWRRVTTGVTADLYAAWGSSPTDLWIVGQSGTILYFDGKTVKGVASPTSASVTAIHGAGPGAVWAIAGSTVLHLEAGAWKLVTLPLSRTFKEIYVASPSDVWLTGSSANLLHYDGTSFTDISVGNTAWKYGIWGRSGSDIWLGRQGEIDHYDGQSWTASGDGVFASTTVDVIHGSPTELWAAGGERVWRRLGTAAWTQVLQVQSSSWQTLNHAGPDATYVAGYARLYALGANKSWQVETSNGAWFYAVAGGGGRVFVGASQGNAFIDEGKGLRKLVWHTPHSSDVNGAWVSWTGVAWMVTNDGRIARYDATNDEMVEEYDGSTGLRAIWGAGPADLWAVGNSGTVLYSDGSGSWTAQTGAGNETWRGVWGANANDVYVVGGYGKIAHFDGSSWAPVDTSAFKADSLYAIHGRSASDIWVVGENATLWHYNGTTWNEATPGGLTLNNDLRGVYVAPSGKIWLTANGDGVVYFGDGKTDWQHHITGASAQLFSIWGSGETDLWVAGSSGTLRHFEP